MSHDESTSTMMLHAMSRLPRRVFRRAKFRTKNFVLAMSGFSSAQVSTAKEHVEPFRAPQAVFDLGMVPLSLQDSSLAM